MDETFLIQRRPLGSPSSPVTHGNIH
jgi:hypothetical protein